MVVLRLAAFNQNVVVDDDNCGKLWLSGRKVVDVQRDLK